MANMKCITLDITQEVLDLLNENKIEFSVELHTRHSWYSHSRKDNPKSVKEIDFSLELNGGNYNGNPYSKYRNKGGNND